MYNDVFCFATFLNPQFGPDSFPSYERDRVLKSLSDNLAPLVEGNLSQPLKERNSNLESAKANFKSRFLKFYDDESNKNNEPKVDNIINDYIEFVKNNDFSSADFSVLKFWQANETRWPALAELAKKVLGVPASSAIVERMFSLSGHIFSVKRRRMRTKLFQSLVYCKLNENLIRI